jgi:FtsH-binding integral membrane protein
MEYAAQPPVAVAREESGFLQRVFLWMFVGLGITGGVAGLIGSNDSLLTEITETPGLVLGVVVAQLAIVSDQSIFTAFLVTAGMFGALAVWGAVTDIDLSKVGAIAFMALIGLILATIVNIFWANETLYWITTYAGVLIFAALTASTSSTSSSSCCGSSASSASRPHRRASFIACPKRTRHRRSMSGRVAGRPSSA